MKMSHGSMAMILLCVSVPFVMGLSCNVSTGPDGAADDPLFLSLWKLERMVVDGEDYALVADRRVTASWTKSEVHGNGGCNSFSGACTAEGGKLEVKDLMMTAMGCEGPINEQESVFTTLMQKATTYRVEEGKLILGDDAAGTLLVFAPFEIENAPLETTQWLLTTFTQTSGDVASASSIEGQAEIEFEIRQGRVSGFGGSSNFRGLVVTDGSDEIHFQSLESDEPEADAGITSQQETFLKLLSEVDQYQINEKTLTLTDSQSGAGMQFQAR